MVSVVTESSADFKLSPNSIFKLTEFRVLSFRFLLVNIRSVQQKQVKPLIEDIFVVFNQNHSICLLEIIEFEIKMKTSSCL